MITGSRGKLDVSDIGTFGGGAVKRKVLLRLVARLRSFLMLFRSTCDRMMCSVYPFVEFVYVSSVKVYVVVIL